ncbi:hypothetical protein [Pararhodospirillum photometricum]|uniref:Uncharacterized protein n=1 Tax=Pararhodospirillum photometricum DSM 122 TaxID=1150469 RepID=H6SJX7_PARPM|nr:hypothetical protein [Pararhodospirillum photometricum]CCG08292.1 unnamed protein product [Pararhodospirillum photometricum DSM 122]
MLSLIHQAWTTSRPLRQTRRLPWPLAVLAVTLALGLATLPSA